MLLHEESTFVKVRDSLAVDSLESLVRVPLKAQCLFRWSIRSLNMLWHQITFMWLHKYDERIFAHSYYIRNISSFLVLALNYCFWLCRFYKKSHQHSFWIRLSYNLQSLHSWHDLGLISDAWMYLVPNIRSRTMQRTKKFSPK